MDGVSQPLASGTGVTRGSSPIGGWKYASLAPFLALLSTVLYSLNGELLQALQVHVSASQGHASPLLNLVICHLGGLAFVPWLFYRVADEGTCRWPPTGNIAAASLGFAFLLMSYNYAWLQSSKHMPAALTNAFFQSSVAMTFLASVILFREPLSKTSRIGVVLAFFGPILASGVVSGETYGSTAFGIGGASLAVLAAVGYTMYQVLFRRLYSHLKNDVRFLAYFFACVSGWHLVAMLPLTLLASAVGYEPLQLPHGTLAVLGTLACAVIASTVNGLYLCIVMWGSPMLLPCASALSVPTMVVMDLIFHHVIPNHVEVIGHSLVVVSVALIMMPHHRPMMPMMPDQQYAPTALKSRMRTDRDKQTDDIIRSGQALDF